MTVKELMDELRRMPLDAQVILQKYGEGNGYSPLSFVDGNAIYVADSTWCGRIYSTRWSWRDACFDSVAEWKEFKATNPRCCVLSPVN